MSERDDRPKTPDRSEDLKDFDRRLSEKIAQHRGKPQPETDTVNAWSVSVKYGSGFAGGVLVGTGLGWMADKVFEIAPWGMLVGVILGFAAGLRNIMREAAAANDENAKREAGTVPGSDATKED
ncbi:MAG: ATP synthase protein I [Maricaulis sp.]|jgi:ATP synthase protein I